MTGIRLDPKEVDLIRQSFRQFFLKQDKLWLFGSRAKPELKGGDIDLYIETDYTTPEDAIMARLRFLTELKIHLGDQKIDVVLKYGEHHLPIYKIAQEEGIRLI